MEARPFHHSLPADLPGLSPWARFSRRARVRLPDLLMEGTMVCPYIDENLKPCDRVLRLGNLELATSTCGDDFRGCEVFRQTFAAQGACQSERGKATRR